MKNAFVFENGMALSWASVELLRALIGQEGLVNIESNQLIRGRVDRMFATETVDMGSIPGLVKPKTIIIGIHSFRT